MKREKRLSNTDYAKVKSVINKIEKEISRIVVGQGDVIRGIIRGILCNGHVLVEGVPGVAKTLIIVAMSKVTGCEMKRIQFTVDLLPTDITGIQSYIPGKGFEIMKGPIFANFIVADEINRSPPKTQSALLEAMQEKKVTISKESYDLPTPFFVMATENPLENSGVYQLPEAQIDRFLFKLIIDYPKIKEEIDILEQNMTTNTLDSYNLKPVVTPKEIIELQDLTKRVFTSEAIKKYIVEIVNVSRRKDLDFSKYVSFGGSPRASISLFIASKAEALMNGRDYVTPKDVLEVIYPVFRHRLILTYQAEADKVDSDTIIAKILKHVSAP